MKEIYESDLFFDYFLPDYYKTEENIAQVSALAQKMLPTLAKYEIDTDAVFTDGSVYYTVLNQNFFDLADPFFSQILEDTEFWEQARCRELIALAELAAQAGNPIGSAVLAVAYGYGVGLPQSFAQMARYAQTCIKQVGLFRQWMDAQPALTDPQEQSLYEFLQDMHTNCLTRSCSLILIALLRAEQQNNYCDVLYDATVPEEASFATKLPADLMAIVMQELQTNETIKNAFAPTIEQLRSFAHHPFTKDLCAAAHENLYLANKHQNDEKWNAATIDYAYASLLGDAEAAVAIAHCWETGSPQGGYPRNYFLALEWYKTAAKMGSSYAMYRVAQYYEQGINVTPNAAIAAACKQQALRMGMPAYAMQ